MDLCWNYSKTRSEYFDYDSKQAIFISRFVNSLMKYFECPERNIQIFMPLKNDREENDLNIYQKVELNEGQWIIAVSLNLYEQSPRFPNESTLLTFIIEENECGFLVRLGDKDSEPFLVESGSPEDLRQVFKFTYEKVKEFYSK